MKTRELFSPIPKEILKNDDVRERVEIFLVLFVVAGLGYKFVKGSINGYQSLDDHNIALAVFANAAVAAAFLLAYLLACWVIRLALSFIYENFCHWNNHLSVVKANTPNDGTVNVQVNLTHQELNVTQVNAANTTILPTAAASMPEPESAAVPEMKPSTSEGPAAKDEKEKALRFEDILTDKGREKVPGAVEKFLTSHHNGRDLACLYLALDNNLYIRHVPLTCFLNAVSASFPGLIDLKARAVQACLKKISDEEYLDMERIDEEMQSILDLINN